MYIFRNEIGLSIFLVMYIDDLLILSEDVDSINSVKSFLSSEFEMKDIPNKWNIVLEYKPFNIRKGKPLV
jgi:hypothetical protein